MNMLTLHAARDGNDDNPGTTHAPLATLVGARDALRARRRTTEGPVSVWVHEGTYSLAHPLELGPEDSGSAQTPITYQACAGERVTLSGGRKLGFDRHSVFADPMFVDPANNDYRVQPDSPALRVGFENVETGQWGLTSAFPRCWWA